MVSPDVITLTGADRQILEGIARSGSAEHRQVVRARIVLAAADRRSNAGIARELGVVEDTVRKWRRRFCDEGMPGLKDRPRSGRPRVFTATTVAEIKALACELPARTVNPLESWRRCYATSVLTCVADGARACAI
ncbi:helix-turn-helix domain-containing protein [Amycolatopsis ultiminotia]